MDDAIQDILRALPIDELMDTPIGEQIKAASRIFESVQKHVFSLAEKQGEEGMTAVKTGTVLLVGIMKRLYGGMHLKDFTSEDWKAICREVDEDVILSDDRQYTQYVFDLYANYIRYSVSMIQSVKGMPPKRMEEILGLAKELDVKKRLLQKDKISEVTYIEDCMWIALEAMIKLLASTAVLSIDRFGADYPEVVHAIASYAFEYGRFALYSREQALLAEYLENQKTLDAELERKYAEYLEDLQTQAEQFRTMIDHAFDPDFREAFLHSIALARAAGVGEEEILTTEEDIDDFFLS